MIYTTFQLFLEKIANRYVLFHECIDGDGGIDRINPTAWNDIG